MASEVTAALEHALKGLVSFVGVMVGHGPACEIPETIRTPLGVNVKIGLLMREAQEALTMRAADNKDAGDGRIKLTAAEIQSGLDRVKWAEGLIRQLPETHDGRNSWLLNFGAAPPRADQSNGGE